MNAKFMIVYYSKSELKQHGWKYYNQYCEDKKDLKEKIAELEKEDYKILHIFRIKEI